MRADEIRCYRCGRIRCPQCGGVPRQKCLGGIEAWCSVCQGEGWLEPEYEFRGASRKPQPIRGTDPDDLCPDCAKEAA